VNTYKSIILLTSLSALLIWMGGYIGGHNGAIIALGFSLMMNFASYWWSDKIVLSMFKAKEVTYADQPELYGDVQELAQNAGLPMPKVYIIPDHTPNAFATGRDTNHSAVAFTQGIMRLLNRNELKGVIAHELAHIKNRDILIGSIAATISTAITYLAYFAMFFGGGSDRGRGNPIALIAMMILAPLAATLIRMAISRTREFVADKSGAEICGNPLYLSEALRRLKQASGKPLNCVSEQTADSTAHMMIVNPLTGGGLTKLFSTRTHPPTEERVRKLEELAMGMS